MKVATFATVLTVALAHGDDTDLSCVTDVWPPTGLNNIYPFTGGEVRSACLFLV